MIIIAAFVALIFAPMADLAIGQAPPQNVRLVIDYGDGGVKLFKNLTWKKGTTVLDVMELAKAHPQGINFKYKGQAATAFLTQIDNVVNEGAGAGKKNWLFWVNTEFGDKSFGVYEVQALDTVTWRFSVWETK